MYTVEQGEYGGWAILHDGRLIDTVESREEAQAYVDQQNGVTAPVSTFEWLNR